MKRSLFRYFGYTDEINYKDKVVYPLAMLSTLVACLFLILYCWLTPFLPAIIVHLLYIGINILSLFLLRRKHYFLAKGIVLISFVIQLTLAVFLWFPVSIGFNFYYILVPVASFLIFNYANKWERFIAISASILAAILYTISEHFTDLTPLFYPTDTVRQLFGTLTIITTLFSMILVFMLYSKELAILHLELKQLANTDGLTRILNRRAFYDHAVNIFHLAKKYDRTFSLILIDIDHFKVVNDTYGHPAGDRILIELSDLITSKTRKQDLFCRYGGEEFALLIQQTKAHDSLMMCHQLLDYVRDHPFTIGDQLTIHITISIGIVQFSKDFSNLDTMIQSVDKALYHAKDKGRDCVVAWENIPRD